MYGEWQVWNILNFYIKLGIKINDMYGKNLWKECFPPKIILDLIRDKGMRILIETCRKLKKIIKKQRSCKMTNLFIVFT